MLNRPASLAMPTSVLKALPGKLDIKRHSPSNLYLHGIARDLGSKICGSMLAFHALTRCDSTSYLCGKGKRRAWRISRKGIGNTESLNRLGESMVIEPHVHETVNSFISLLYSPKSDGDVN